MHKTVILFVAVSLVLAAAVERQYNRKICEPYSVFKVDCNTCRCTADGTNMACTRMACRPNPGLSSEPSCMNNKKEEMMCEPGSYFKMDCNNCICNDDGTNAACTLKACPKF